MSEEVSVREGSVADFPAVLKLAQRSLGWTDSDARYLDWKHRENPLGTSPMWVAEADDRVVGFRTFLRWDLVEPGGRVVHAVRAVDTATDPDYQGGGIFTRLTRGALEPLREQGIEMIFNTPNEKSRPGYLKMGWSEVGRLPVEVRPNSWRFPIAVARARQGADREAIATSVGAPAAEALNNVEALQALLAEAPPVDGWTTHRTPAHLAWRYGNPDLEYRAVLAGSIERGVAIFRLRSRGSATEAVVAEVIARAGDESARRVLLRAVAAVDADYLLRIGRAHHIAPPSELFVRLPRIGPILAHRSLVGAPSPPLAAWSLSLGDVELL
jgi:GNAT superfamily N-acetyltransferase